MRTLRPRWKKLAMIPRRAGGGGRSAEAAGRLTLTGMYFDLAEAKMYAVDPLGLPRPVAA
jgi:hypothetical protein